MPWDHTQVFNTVYQSKYSTVMSHPILRVSPSPTQHSVCETLRSFSFTFTLVVSHNNDTPIYVFSSDLVLSLIIKTKTFIPRSNLTGKHNGKVTVSHHTNTPFYVFPRTLSLSPVIIVKQKSLGTPSPGPPSVCVTVIQ